MFQVRAALCSVILYLGLANYNVVCTNRQVGIESYFALEAIYINQLEAYLQKVQEKHDKIIRYLEYVDLVHKFIEDSEEYFGNPLNAFITISRFVNNWQHEIIHELASNEDFENFKQSLDEELDTIDVEKPTADTLLDATIEAFAFQASTNVPISQLTSGKIEEDNEQDTEDCGGSVKQPVRLTSSECYAMGRKLSELQEYDTASEWLLQARSQLSQDSNSFPNISHVDILESLATAYAELGHFKLANKLNNDLLKAVPEHKAALQAKIELEHKLVLERSEIPL